VLGKEGVIVPYGGREKDDCQVHPDAWGKFKFQSGPPKGDGPFEEDGRLPLVEKLSAGLFL